MRLNRFTPLPALAVVLLIAGCGGSTRPTSAPPATDSAAATTVPATVPSTPTATATATTTEATTTVPEPDSPSAGVEVILSTLQGRLAQLGYRAGPVTGEFSAATLDALRAFQSTHAINSTERGAIGPATAAAMAGGGSDVVDALQSALTEVGLFSGTINGTYDAATTAAVTALQHESGLAADGFLGPQSFAALQKLYLSRDPEPVADAGAIPDQSELDAPKLLKLGSTGPAVKQLQQRLTQLGYRPGSADGSFGAATASAVLAFQKRNGLDRDSVVGPGVEMALAHPTGAGPKPGPTPRIDVDIARQIVFVVSKSGSVTTLNTSTGNGETYSQPGGGTDVADTPVGSFTVERKIPGDHRAPLGTLRNPLFFYRGWAIHGAASVPAYPASHGCARVSNSDADWLYPQVAIGSPVVVYDSTGKSPTVSQLGANAAAGF